MATVVQIQLNFPVVRPPEGLVRLGRKRGAYRRTPNLNSGKNKFIIQVDGLFLYKRSNRFEFYQIFFKKLYLMPLQNLRLRRSPTRNYCYEDTSAINFFIKYNKKISIALVE